MPSVYVETTIPSYLVAEPSRDLIVAANQQLTHEWWSSAKQRFDLFVSEVVMEEIRAGKPGFAARRVEAVSELPVLDLNEDVHSLDRIYREQLGLPERARTDVLHIAIAVSYELDYLATWNCAHIANGRVLRRLMEINHNLGRFTPILLTPAELLEPREENTDG